MAGVGRGSFSIAAIIFLVHTVISAPVTEEGTSHALQLGDVNGDGRGCYYNFEHYDEGDRILTNEPCLNCTCHNRMLMCYLRVCPFTKSIGQDCTVEKKPDQCCPIITCPQVPVALLTSSTTSETPTTTTALGRPDNYGCILEDNTFYPDGAQVPSDARKPCELCYCIRNHTACVMQECTLNVEGCRPVYQEGVCCPVRYDCDYDEVLTTPKPLGLVTTPGGSSDCLHDGIVYHDGAMVLKDEKAPCEHCYCMRGDIVCAVQECGTPLEGRDCTPMEPTPGQCCPNYHCANGTALPEVVTSEPASTEKLPEAVKEEGDQEKQDSEESSNETDNSSEESNESVSEQRPPQSADSTQTSSIGETPSHHEELSTDKPEQSNVYEEGSTSESNLPESEVPLHPEATEDAAKTPEPNNTPVDDHTADSDSEASQHQVSEAQAPEEAINPEVTNEIPESTPYEHSTSATTEEPVEAARVPGEGSCLVDGKTYAHNAVIPTANPCQELCRCFSSIVSCKPRDCPPAPSADENCMPVTAPGSCCPTYMCDQKTSDAPEVQDHKIDNFPHEETPGTVEPAMEDLQTTEAPVAAEIPSDSLTPGSHEHELSSETTEGPVDTHNEEHVQTEKPVPEYNQISGDENGQANSDLVHGIDAALHGGQSEHMDSHENGKLPHPIGDITTVGPVNEDNIVDQTGEEGFNPVTTLSSVSHTEVVQTPDQNEGTVKPHTSDLQPLAEQDEGSGQEYVEATSATEIINEPQYQTFPVTSEPESMASEETTSQANIKSDNEVAETVTEEHSHVTNEDSSVTSEETKSEESASVVGDVSSDKSDYTTQANTFQIEQQTESPISQQLPIEKHPGEVVTTDNQILQENNQELTTVVESSADASQDSNAQGTENSQKEEDIHVEAPQQNFSGSDDQVHSDHGLDATPDSAVESHQDISTHEPSGEEVSYEITHDNLSPTDEPQPNLLEPEPQTTSQPVENESDSQTIADNSHHDAVSESSQHFVDISEEIITESPIKEEEPGHQEGTETQDRIPGDVNESSTSSSQTQGAESSEQVATDNGAVNTEQDNKETIIGEKTTEVNSEDVSSEIKLDELSTSSPLVNEDETSPTQSPKETSPVHSSDVSHHDYSTIIYEEVKVSGMPSIESHVTEKTSDFQLPSSTAKPDTHPVTEDVHVPGPEGINVEQEVEKGVEENVKQDETGVQKQNEVEVKKEEEQDNQENVNVVQPQAPSEPISVPSDEKPEVDEPEMRPGEEITPSHGAEESSPQDASEAGSAVAETIHHGTNAPEITNEINEEKEPLDQTSSDNAEQLGNENQQQNEVSNELIPGENVDQTQTEHPLQTHQGHTEAVPVSSPDEPSAEVTPNEDTIQETTVTSIVTEKSPSFPEINPQDPFQTVLDSGKIEDPVKEDISGDHPEEKPTHDVSGDSESDLGTTVIPHENNATPTDMSSVNVPSSDNIPSHTLHEAASNEPKPTNANEEDNSQAEVSGETSENQSSTESILQTPEESITDQTSILNEHNQLNEDVTNKPVKETPVHETQNETQDNLNEISTKRPQENIPDTPAVESDQLSDTHADNGVEEDVKVPSVNEDQNALVEDVTHVESNIPQVPDSANQLLETPEKEEEVKSTVQPPSESDIQSAHDISEQPSSPNNALPNEENISEEHKIDPVTETQNESQEEIDQGLAPTEPPQSPNENEESPDKNQETPSEHQEIPSQPQEVPSETEHIPLKHGEPTTEHYEISSEKHEISSEQPETTAPQQEIVSESQESTTEKQETVTEQHEIVAEHHETVSEHQGISSDNQYSGSEQEEPISEHQQIAYEHTEVAPESQESVSGQQETSSVHQEMGSEQQETGTEHQETLSNHKENTSETQDIVSENQETSEQIETVSEHQETSSELQETSSEQQETNSELQETSSEHQETNSELQETSSEHQETSSEHQEIGIEHDNTNSEHQETVTDHVEAIPQQQETVSEKHETITEHHEDITEHQESSTEQETVEHHETESGHPQFSTEVQESTSEHHESVTERHETTYTPQDNNVEHHETVSEHHESTSEQLETIPEEGSEPHHENIPEKQETESEHDEGGVTELGLQETSSEQNAVSPQETVPDQEETTSEHHDAVSEHELHIPTTESSDKEISTSALHTEISHEVEGHVSTEATIPSINEETSPESQTIHNHIEVQKQDVPTTHAPLTEGASQNPTQSQGVQSPDQITELIQSIAHSTETASLSENPSSTKKPLIEEPSPMFPTWSQKPFDHHTTPEPHTPDENPYPSGFDPEYEDEEGVSYGPGTCRYGGKVYLSAQQIPRDDPCDFCFCFRSDIICLQQSCPPPIRGCYQETIKGFCCPRYECHVSMATMLNITTTTTTTTTTLPPHFFAHAYNGAATKAGCQVKGVAYHVGERIPSTSGPCLECRCGANGQMKCDPTVCGPQEALLRQVMDAAVSKRRR